MRRIAVVAMVMLLAPKVFAQDDEVPRASVVAKVKSFSDEQLRQSLEKLLDSLDFRKDPSYEPCLNEVVRRGGEAWEAFLSAKLEMLNKKQLKRSEDDEDTGRLYNLELLTALRRVQKKPDPLEVLLDAKGPLEGTPLSLPRLKVTLKNVDCEKATVGFRNSGDYRTGRQARWRIVARNGKGAELPVNERPFPQHGGLIVREIGGTYQEGVLEYGESWETVLDVGRFVKIRQPGTYSLEVLYHNTKAIVDESDINGLVFYRSKPTALVVRSLVIEVTAQERKQAAQWISALDASQRLKVVAGTYGKWAHEFVPPGTPEGKLLSMGIKAVPALVESLKDKSLSDKKRAWILTLLYSATGENDPCDTGAPGEYDYLDTGWGVGGGFSEERQSGG
jgi:hypothetical protein